MSEEPSGSGGRGPTHPSHLKGKEIGLYYRDKQLQQRQNDEKEEEKIKLNPSVDIPPDVLLQAESYLNQFDNNDRDERASYEFAEHFNKLRDINFEQFLEKSKTPAGNVFKNVNFKECNERLLSDSLNKKESNNSRQSLPATKQKDEILKAVQDNQVVLIVGSTGCGKTTQVPQILLDDCISHGHGAECRIICTQPRRISAISVAERVAFEREEPLGVSVGYKIRLDGRKPRDYGSILYCTSGILLQKMQYNPLVLGVNYIILDEIHERTVETDILMALVKKILPYRPDLKLILMSATVSEETFCQYFDNCFTMHIEGTLFPVEVLYLEDILNQVGFQNFQNNIFDLSFSKKKSNAELLQRSAYVSMITPYLPTLREKYDSRVVHLIRKYQDSEGCENLDFIEYLIFHICGSKPPGAILVFLPGYERISALAQQLNRPVNPIFRALAKYIQVYVLHSMMPTANQKSIFKPPLPGVRKIILSTILAETSITIDDVVYVINTGRTKSKDYDLQQNIESLEEDWVSKANTQQRKGRAGRVQPGICYNLFTRVREDCMIDVPLPEILRSKLESIILNLKLLHIANPYEFFQTLISVPDEKAVIHGLNLLKRIEALDENDSFTPLGVHLARLPIDPQMGKMILMSTLFRCVDPITSAAAGLSYKTPFFTPIGAEKKVDCIKRELSNNSRSDHLLIHYVVQGYREAKTNKTTSRYCHDNFVSYTNVTHIENMKNQFADLLERSRFLETSDCRAENSNINSTNLPLLRAVIAAGLYPNIACLNTSKIKGNKCYAAHKMSTPEDKCVNFSVSSINNGQYLFDSKYFVYFQKQRFKGVYLLDSTMVFPMALLIFGDGVKQGKTEENESYISVANKYFFKCNEESILFILRLREKLQVLLRKKALYPSPIKPDSKDEKLIKAIETVLSLDDDNQFLPRNYAEHNSILLK